MPTPAVLAALSIGLAACGPSTEGAERDADLVLRNGSVYTVASPGWVEAVAVRDGRLSYVGSDEGASVWTGPATRVVDLRGSLVLPGFHDSHVHPVKGGLQLRECELAALETRSALLETIRRCADRADDDGWVRGRGWDLPMFPDRGPSRYSLDSVVPDRPVYLISGGGHSAWVNTAALEAAGITPATDDPPGGRIERDPGTGAPSGTLREAAMELVAAHVPARGQEDYVEALRDALTRANRYGITSIHEAAADRPMLEAYAELDRRGALSARVVASIRVDPSAETDPLVRLREWRERYTGTRFRAHAAKIFADGVIEAGTAALLEPYLDAPGDSGSLNIGAGAMVRLVTALDREGFQVHIHAIGDRAVRAALDAIEEARDANGPRDARHHLAHIQLIDPRDIPRFARLEVLANFQPLWAYADRYITELTEPRLGPERSRWLYPIASVARTGARIVAGSDWPVTSIDPLDAIEVAVTRRAPDAGPGPAWIPEERVELPTIIAAYTLNGAFLNRQEATTGSLEVGKAADLIVLDRNIFEVPPEGIGRARVMLTMLEGTVVYRDPSWPARARPEFGQRRER